MAKELVLITVTGLDRPGITASFMGEIHQNGGSLEDMGQSIIHGQLSLSFLVAHENKTSLIDHLQNLAQKLQMEISHQIITDKKTIRPAGDRYIVTCVCLKGITPSFVHDIATCLAASKINILRIDNLREQTFTSVEFTVVAQTENVDWTTVKESLMKISNDHTTDIALIKDDIWRRNKRLIVLDMDSTLIQQEVIVEMARLHGVGDEVHEITERAMNGELNFDESLTQRVQLLKGFPVEKMEEVLKNLPLTDGAEEFIKTLKRLNHKIAIISGGFNYFAKALKETLHLDYAFANELEIKDGKLTGNVLGSIVNAEKKALLLELISQQEGIRLEQVVAIGDGANDLQMLAKAGLGIAFHAKEIVRKEAKQHMSHGPMTSILYFLGIPGIDV